MRPAAFGLALCLAGVSPCLGDDLKAEAKFGATEISFELKGTYSGLTLTVTGPNGLHASAASATAAPTVDLKRLSAIDDGIYRYNLTGSTGEKLPERSGLDNGRDRPGDTLLKSVSTSGVFEVKGGAIVKVDPSVPRTVQQAELAGSRTMLTRTSLNVAAVLLAAACFASGKAAADQVIPDDLIVQGSLCVGFDCVNNEVFDFDTIRLKENNLRILFHDTSVGAAFRATTGG